MSAQSQASSTSTVNSDKDRSSSSSGFQELQVVKKKVKSGQSVPTSENVNVDELMKALKVVRKAKERNIDLTTSMESLAMRSLKTRHKRRQRRKTSLWERWRWSIYVTLWITAFVYFLALLNRNTVCPYITDPKTTEF
ncbi:hypothetical protein RB195_003587 [Necator americanus]|uniref:Uncharacterized protein n=1 Tax=Necator americanus TaxID=51031 RepID=A0ABR1DP85_NECAM